MSGLRTSATYHGLSILRMRVADYKRFMPEWPALWQSQSFERTANELEAALKAKESPCH